MKQGTLYVVSTPIGNLEDITLRAIRILKEVDLIAAEDTRTVKKLLNHFEIKKPLTSLFEHNEDEKKGRLLKQLECGESIALVSEAGTPCISDPGYRFIRAAWESGFKIVPIPGVTAAITALSVSGLPTNRFTFIGFLPDKSSKRKRVLEGLKEFDGSLIFYVSKYKIKGVLLDMIETLGDRNAVYCRELTKVYEEVKKSTLRELLAHVSGAEVRGEITLVVEGNG